MKRSHLLLGPRHKFWLYSLTGLLWISGTGWLLLPVGHSAQSLVMRIHGAAAMGFLMAFGAVLLSHVPQGWRDGSQRPSGTPLVVLCALLILSGWGLYYLANETVRHWLSLCHWIAGLLLPILIVIHIRLGKSRTL